MRVIGGSRRGRLLRAPAGDRTRPTADRVREAIFDVLGSVLGPDGLVGRSVVDLFAGSGALGIEALSRGAGPAVFVDSDRRAVAAVRRNLADLGLGDGEAPVEQGDGTPVAQGDGAAVVRAEVVQADVLAWLAGPGSGRRFDLALCDPPYAFDDWPALFGRLRADVVVVESDRPVEVPAPWHALKHKRYGSTLVTVAISTPTSAAVPAATAHVPTGRPAPAPSPPGRREKGERGLP